MPRNSAGVYTLPSGNPVTPYTTISSSWGNTTMSDIATALTGSLARNGDGGMTGPFKADSGSVGAPGLSWASETTAGWYRAGAGDFRFAIGGSAVVTITSAGISAGSLPTNIAYKDAANTFTAAQVINAGAATEALMLLSNAGIQSALGLQQGGQQAVYLYQPGSSSDFAVWVNGGNRLQISSAGNVTISAPSSGTALTVAGVPGVATDFHAAGAAYSQWRNTSSTILTYGGSDSSSGFIGTGTAHPFYFYSNAVARGLISSAGNWTINAPGSGTSLTINVLSGGDARLTGSDLVQFYTISTGNVIAALKSIDSATAGWVGTESNHPFRIATNNSTRVTIGTTGGVQVGSPTGGDLGSGTINVSGDIAINGEYVAYRNLLSRNVTGSTSTEASDNGRLIYYGGSGGHTITLDTDLAAGGIVQVMVGSGGVTLAITGGGTLFWFGGAGSLGTGSRTLAIGAVATCFTPDGANWYIWGSGIS